MVTFHSDEDYLAAVQDAAYDRFLETAVRCRECGTRYDQGHRPATRRPDDLLAGLDRHDTAARERHRAGESREHGRLRRRRADQLLRI